MSENAQSGDTSDDWISGSTIEATASDLTFFGGSSVPVDASQLPEPTDGPDVA
jgi:hypothetical protein